MCGLDVPEGGGGRENESIRHKRRSPYIQKGIKNNHGNTKRERAEPSDPRGLNSLTLSILRVSHLFELIYPFGFLGFSSAAPRIHFRNLLFGTFLGNSTDAAPPPATPPWRAASASRPPAFGARPEKGRSARLSLCESDSNI